MENIMSEIHLSDSKHSAIVRAATLVLLVLTTVMLLALFSRTAPHPLLEVAPFAIAPFLGASLAIGLAAFHLLARNDRIGLWLTLLFVVTALVSFGPQKYFDPTFSRIWPAVVTAQIAVVVALVSCFLAFVRKKQAAR
jgi:hypothetical protein